MSFFNKFFPNKKSIQTVAEADVIASNETVNHEGAQAWNMSSELELYTAVVTASLSDSFYEKADRRIERIANLVDKVSPEFTARLAVYARTRMNLRTVPMFLLVELASRHNGDSLVSRAVAATVCRADEIMELLTAYQWRNPVPNGQAKRLGKLSNQIKVGLERAFNKFDEYQFAKYNRTNRDVKLRDALFIVHPKADSPEQQEIFDKIATDTLETPFTWETQLSDLGTATAMLTDRERETAKAKVWKELILSGKLGYMAMLRNLRNISELKRIESSVINNVCQQIADPERVRKSRQFPFRFLSAYRELGAGRSAKLMRDALEDAMIASADNISGFDRNTRVVLACDVSGSMYTPVSAHSTVRCYDIGLTLAMLLRYRCMNVVTGLFGDTWMRVELPKKNILANVQSLNKLEGRVGYSTNGHTVIDDLIERREVVDKVMMFTDMQMWDSGGVGASLKASWENYRRIAPGAKLYLFDLVGYGQAPLRIPARGVYVIAGWSDKIFDVLDAIENGSDALRLIKAINI